MNIEVLPGVASGYIAAPPSKSMAHRQLIAAGLSAGTSIISGIEFSEDILATLDCLRALGVVIEEDKVNRIIAVTGTDLTNRKNEVILPCRESGSTMRFFIPLALLVDKQATFTGSGRLLERPMTIYKDICQRQGLLFEQMSNSIRARGPLHAAEFSLPGNISSQFLTGLLFALPLLAEESEIRLTTPLESRPYVDLTLSVLSNYGISVQETAPNVFSIPGGQVYTSVNGFVEGDYSNAAFLDALNCLGGRVTVEGINDNSLQGDRKYRTYFRELECGSPELDIQDCPDLAPILMTLAAALNGCTLQGTRRLKIKESDRGETMAHELRKFGASIDVYDDTIIVNKAELHNPNEPLEGHNDHRIVMSLAVLATKYGGKIFGAQAVNKSYPSFWDILHSIGIQTKEIV